MPESERGTCMERIKKQRCGIRMSLLFLWMVFTMTGCTRRQEIFLEEMASDEENSGEEKSDEEKSAEKNLNEKNLAEENLGKKNSAEENFCGKTGEADASFVTPVPQKIFVDVCGAVVRPGVYELEEGARIFQAVDAAGGYLPEAAMNYLNRARSLGDGQQIYVPTETEVEENLEFALAKVPEALTEGENTGDLEQNESSGGQNEDSRVNLNTADAGQLSTLSGIGQSKAEAIVAYREEHGGFTSIEEIMNVEGIKEGTFSKIKDKISTG